MAEQNVRIREKTDEGYDILYPASRGSIITYDNSTSGATATNVQSALDETFERIIVVKNVSVAVSAWVSDVSHSGYQYKANINVSEVTADYVPDVYFSETDVNSGNFASYCETGSGHVTIWAITKPSSTITIPIIKLIK